MFEKHHNKTEYVHDTLEEYQGAAYVTHLTLRGYPISKRQEPSLAKFCSLKYLRISTADERYHLPAVVASLPKLEALVLERYVHEDAWPILAQLPHLKYLAISIVHLQRFPEALVHCQQLEELDLLDSRFSENFEGWEQLTQLPNLKALNLSKCKLTPKHLKGLEELSIKILLLPSQQVGSFYKKQPSYCQQLWYYFTNKNPKLYSYQDIKRYSDRQQLDGRQRAILLNLADQNMDRLATLAQPEQLLAITDYSDMESLAKLAISYHTHLSPPLHPQAHLTVLGQISSDKMQLQEQLAAIDIAYSEQLSPFTTHVLIGLQSQGAYQAALNQGLPFLSEQQVLEYINKTGDYYLVGNEELLAKVEQLVCSGKEENLMLAVNFLEQGGVDSSLLTLLFYGYQLAYGMPVQQDYKLMLQHYGSALLAKHIKGNGVYDLYQYEGEAAANLGRHLYTLRDTELDLSTLAIYLYEADKLKIAQLVRFVDEQKQLHYLQQKVKGKALYLRFQQLHSLPAMVYTMKHLEVLHVEKNKLKTILIHRLKKMPHLRAIHIKGNKLLCANQHWLTRMAEQLPHLTIHL